MTNWTPTPPQEPGWYWWREAAFPDEPEPSPVFDVDGELFTKIRGHARRLKTTRVEWWPIRIQEPGE